MSDEDTRSKRSQQRKRNYFAKVLRDQNDFKGAFSLKIYEDRRRKEKYPRSYEDYDD